MSTYVDQLAVHGAVIQNCVTTSNGGAINNGTTGAFVLTDSILTNNSAKSGGAVNTAASQLNPVTVENVQFIDNTASDQGGAFYMNGNLNGYVITMENCTFTGNTAVNGGGAIMVSRPAAMIINACTLTDNHNTGTRADTTGTTTYTYRGGGAIAVGGTSSTVSSATVVITGNTTISGNTAATNGGAYAGDNNILLVAGSLDGYEISTVTSGMDNPVVNSSGTVIIENNEAAQGGGIYKRAGVNTITDGVIIQDNSATNGGGMYATARTNISGDVQFLNNTAEEDGGAIRVTHSLVYTEGGPIVFSGNRASQGYWMTDESHINTHNSNIQGDVTWHGDHDYLYNNHDVYYTQGETRPPEPVSYITNEQELRAALAEPAVDGVRDLVLAASFAVDDAVELDEAGTYAFSSYDPDQSFTITAAGSRHIYVAGDDISLTFEHVTLAGDGTGGGIQARVQVSDLEITGAVITNCYSAPASISGGAISMAGSSSVTVTDCEIVGNAAQYHGGGISTAGGTVLTIQGNTQIRDNVASATASTGSGGGIYSLGPISISGDVIISGNRTEATSLTNGAGSGGGIYLHGNYVHTISGNVVISNNYSANHGGGVSSNFNGLLTISDGVTISNNKAESLGGGIYSSRGITISNAFISGNEAGSDGGGLCAATIGITITDTVISDNTSGGRGGGIHATGTYTADLTNVTVTGNTAAGYGGGIYASHFTTIIDSEISGNTGNSGGGIYVSAAVTRQLHVSGTQIAGNTATTDGGAIHYDNLQYLFVKDSDLAGNEAGNGGRYLTDEADAAIHAANIGPNVTWHEDHDYAYNNHDIVYTQGSETPPEPEFKIVDEATLLEAIERGYAEGGVIELPIAVPEIRLSAAIELDAGAQLNFTVDPEPVEDIDGGVTITAANTRHMRITADGITLTFAGVVLDGAAAAGGIEIFVSEAEITMDSMVLQNCRTTEYGGAMYIQGDLNEITLSNCLIKDNQNTVSTRTLRAGAIYMTNARDWTAGAKSGTLYITDSEFTGNRSGVENPLGGNGGAIYTNYADIVAEGSSFRDNEAVNRGGAIYATTNNQLITVKATDCVFDQNRGSHGGAIYAYTAALEIENSAFTDNTVTEIGGAIWTNAANYWTDARYATFSGDTVFSGNRAEYGGAIGIELFSGRPPVITLQDDVQIIGNSATEDGGGIYTTDLSFVHVRDNVVMSDNTAGNGGRYLVEPDHADLHARQIDEDTVTWHEDYDYAYNNHDIVYTDGSEVPPAFKIVDEATLRQALEAGLASGDPVIYLPIAVEEIEMAQNLSIGQAVEVVFTTDEEVDSATLVMTSGSRHITLFTTDDMDISLRFENVTLDGGGVGGGILATLSTTRILGMNLSIDGAELVNCYNNASTTPGNNGGAIRVAANSGQNEIAIRNTSISGSYAVGGGGGAYLGVSRGSIAIENSRFAGNRAGDNGGGLAIVGGTGLLQVDLTDVTVSGNAANTGTSGVGQYGGGGIYVRSAVLNVAGSSVISDNEAAKYGGGIAVTQTSASLDVALTVSDSTVISDNSAGYGGGIYAYMTSDGGIPILIENDVQITDNTANYGGGVWVSRGDYTSLSGIYLEDLEIRDDVAFSGNASSQGYWLTNPADAALHARNVDETVTFSGEYEYAYNNDDVSYVRGGTEPPVPDIPVEKVTINTSSLTIVRVGSTGTLTATVTPDNATDKTVKWSVSNSNLVQIDEDTGEYRVIGPGLCQITATAGNGVEHFVIFNCC